MKSQKAQVKSGPKIFDADELNNVNETAVEYFDQSQSSAQNYIVTDCDIDMSGTKTNAIDISCGLLNTFEVVECVGPMLTIEDIPTDYPLYNHVMNRHISQSWGNTPQIIDTNFGQIAFQVAPIDTTFAVHRRGEPFRRLKSGLRLYRPYEAKHLDWYVTSPASYSKGEAISHWANQEYINENYNVPLHYDKFYVIKKNSR